MKPTAAATIKHFDEILNKLQAAQTVEPVRGTREKGNTGRLDVSAYCSHFGIEIVKTKDAPGGGTMHCLKRCVFDENHSPNEASIIQQATGKLLYQCFHNSCSDKRWRDARRIISGEQSLDTWLVGGNVHHNSANRSDAKTEDGEQRDAIPPEGPNPSDPGDPNRPDFGCV